MKFLSHIITVVLFIVYFFGGLVISQLTYGESIPLTIAAAVCYAMVMIITMGTLFESFPEPLQKYFRNKTPDNPDGCS